MILLRLDPVVLDSILLLLLLSTDSILMLVDLILLDSILLCCSGIRIPPAAAVSIFDPAAGISVLGPAGVVRYDPART